ERGYRKFKYNDGGAAHQCQRNTVPGVRGAASPRAPGRTTGAIQTFISKQLRRHVPRLLPELCRNDFSLLARGARVYLGEFLEDFYPQLTERLLS
ncbi:50S ribosomal protein L13, partial [Frankliniella fusca]